MTPDDIQRITATLAASSLLVAGLGVALYVWYAAALSRLFPKLGGAGWKGWVPIVNEVEILVRGGVPGWSVVFYFLPIVQLYGVYLKALAVHRIGQSFGKGAGYTVLGIFLPPLWATLLAASRMPAEGDYDRRVQGLLSGVEPVTLAATSPAYASAPPAPAGPAVPVAFPTFVTSPEPERPFVPEPPAPRPPEPAAESANVYIPWAMSPDLAPSANELTIITPAPPIVPPAPPVGRTVTMSAPRPDVPEPVAQEDDDESDRTIVIERRPPVPWRLVTDEGHVIPLRTRVVVLGRKPVSGSGDIAVVTVPDTTKTLSKSHARLELTDEDTWTVTDLDSTNGVIIIEPDGTERLLAPGGSAPVPARFMLGKVAMRIGFDDVEATR